VRIITTGIVDQSKLSEPGFKNYREPAGFGEKYTGDDYFTYNTNLSRV